MIEEDAAEFRIVMIDMACSGQHDLLGDGAVLDDRLNAAELLPTPSPVRVSGVKSAGYANIELLPR